MKLLNTRKIGIPQILSIVRRNRSKAEDVETMVRVVIDRVKKKGDRALFEYTERFDGVRLKRLKVSSEEIRRAYRMVPKKVVTALRRAKRNIEKFHSSLICRKEAIIETEKGVKLWRVFRPIETVGLYIPGGKAVYPSTVLMLGIPAKLAGCERIILCVPPLRDGSLPASILVAADLCGITEIFKVGGAQAIAAMAYGTKTIPKVSKIFGPGNQYVTTAKLLVYGEVDIDMPAGPSEVAVIADRTAKAGWVAADLLSQLEHGTDSQAVLITFSESLARSVMEAMKEQMEMLPRRDIMKQSFAKSFAIVVRSIEEAVEVTNGYAPEHLEIVCRLEQEILRKIQNAGSIFLGPYASEPLGDYATGANHTLPTSGFAKMFPPLSTESFGKMIQVQRVSRAGITKLRKTVETLATTEGLDAHKNAVTIRFLTPQEAKRSQRAGGLRAAKTVPA